MRRDRSALKPVDRPEVSGRELKGFTLVELPFGRLSSSLSLRAEGRTTRHGFTLVELLVVVAIIALLLGILLPALGAAREAAQATVCMAHVRGAGMGIATYAVDARDFLPGPNTSGLQLTFRDAGYSFSERETEPVQNMDWVSPSLGASLGLPEDRDERLVAIFNHRLKCPSNKQTYDRQYGSGGPSVDAGTLNIASYGAIEPFHVYKTQADAPQQGGRSGIYNRSWIESVVGLPTGYKPRLNAVGSPSGKVFATDGVRYLDHSNGQVTFNAFVKQIDGGNFMTWSPAMANVVNNGNPFRRHADGSLTDLAEQYAYRHGQRINAAYLDGHAEALGNDESRDVDLYFPSGSIVHDAAETDDPNDSDGEVIQ